MSTSLYWEPVMKKDKYLGYSLKFSLGPKYFDHDGSLSGDVYLDEGELPYLRGLHDGLQDDAKKECAKLIELIEKHGEIHLMLRG